MLKPFIFLIFPLLLATKPCPGQNGTSPYGVSWKKEALYLTAGGVTAGLGLYLRDETPVFTPDELTTLDPQDVNAFDRLAIDLESPWADHFSDVLLIGTTLAPALLFAGERPRQDFFKLGILYGEVLLINGGLVQLSKFAFRRPRPYVFNSNIDISNKQNINARAAFISGHTAQAAASSFFIARVFSDYYPDSRWKPVVWAAAATMPAVVGFLRVRSGRHFPTDVMAGYAVGAAIGALVPQLHKIRATETGRMSFYPGINGGALVWDFQRPPGKTLIQNKMMTWP